MGTAALMLLSAGGVAGAAPAVKPDPNAAPPKVHGPEKTTLAAAAGARPASGKTPKAAPLSRNAAPGGFQRVNSQKVQLTNTVTDPDGDKANLTFEVWTADAAGKPVTKVS
ncbi:hypothetical protein ABZ252_00170 [Streptomyces sp. NPDC006175]|uniref:hypothetical protein n=1 Tax=Streptomyces sp. NPDC006175 TaxID=3154471 RepID=UPI0033B33E5D